MRCCGTVLEPGINILIILSLHHQFGVQARPALSISRRMKCRAVPQNPDLRLRGYIIVASIRAPANNAPPVRHTAIARNVASVTSQLVRTVEPGHSKDNVVKGDADEVTSLTVDLRPDSDGYKSRIEIVANLV